MIDLKNPHSVKPSEIFGQSPSSIGLFETCPRQYAHRYLLRDLPFVETDAQREGIDFHYAADRRIAIGAELPPKYSKFEPVMAVVCAMPHVQSEVTLAVGKDYKASTWRSRAVGCKIDVLSLDRPRKFALVLDWKTGRPKEDMLQLNTNALTVLANHLDIDTVEVRYVFVKHAQVSNPVVLRRERIDMLETYMHRKIHAIKIAHENAEFEPRPSGLCKAHCDVFNCEHNKREGP